MSIRELEKLLGHSLDDAQSNRDFSLDRAQRSDHRPSWMGIRASGLHAEKPVAQNTFGAEEISHES